MFSKFAESEGSGGVGLVRSINCGVSLVAGGVRGGCFSTYVGFPYGKES